MPLSAYQVRAAKPREKPYKLTDGQGLVLLIAPTGARLWSRVDEKRGKGSHVTLYFGDHLTVVRNPKDELKSGTLHAMCKQLGIDKSDL